MKNIITIIRIANGWHFLYEGCIKLFSDGWSAESFLNNSRSFLSGFYHWLAASPVQLAVIDFLNVWGLILIGLALFLGVFVRWASLAGALLLTLYYFAYPPFGVTLLTGDESVFIINQLSIEAVVLIFFFLYRERGYGLDNVVRLLEGTKYELNFLIGKKNERATVSAEVPSDVNKRREMLKNLTVLPVLGLTGWSAIRNADLNGVDTTSGATIQVNKVGITELKGELPMGKLGSHEISRLILGGNILASNMHPRDLKYVNSLSKAYNTEKKAFETLMLAEQAGINNINLSLGTLPVINKYKKLTGSKIKVSLFASLYGSDDIILEEVKKAVDGGVDFIHTHGAHADICARDNKIDLIGKMIDEVRRQGCVAGLAAHTIDTLIICEENGIIPDFYQKTMHHDNYWSAHPREHRKKYEFTGTIKNNFSLNHNEFHDNLWCPFPEQTLAFLNRTQVPMIGFKVLAAGAIPPKDGFKWAFENGADFICVGMFDFQIVNDVNICIDTLNNLKNRKRGWYA